MSDSSAAAPQTYRIFRLFWPLVPLFRAFYLTAKQQPDFWPDFTRRFTLSLALALHGLFGSLPAAAAAATKHSTNVMSSPVGATPSPGAVRKADSITDLNYHLTMKKKNYSRRKERGRERRNRVGRRAGRVECPSLGTPIAVDEAVGVQQHAGHSHGKW